MNIKNTFRKALLTEESMNSISRVVKVLNSLEFKDDIIKNGGEIYAVGGIVRDALMGKASDDLDIVVRGIPYENLYKILSRYGKATDTSKENDDKKDFGATKFVSKNSKFNEFLSSNGLVTDIDVMLPRKDAKDPSMKGHKGITSDVNHNYTIIDDLERRDITMNAIALSLDGDIIDTGRGKEDLKNNIIRAVSTDAFIEDPLRMVRAIRFAARFNSEIEPDTLNLIRQNVKLLSDKQELPAERFLMEFKKMIGKADLGRAVKLLVELGMYNAIFGVDYPNTPFEAFNKVKTVGEMGYLLFKGLPNAVELYTNNIDNTVQNINELKALIMYERVDDGNFNTMEEIKKLAELYKLSKVMFDSDFVSSQAKMIADKFKSGELPANQANVKLSGNLIGPMIMDYAKENGLRLNKKDVGVNIGKIKRAVIDAVYSRKVKNDENEIEAYVQSILPDLFK